MTDVQQEENVIAAVAKAINERANVLFNAWMISKKESIILASVAIIAYENTKPTDRNDLQKNLIDTQNIAIDRGWKLLAARGALLDLQAEFNDMLTITPELKEKLLNICLKGLRDK